MDRAFLRQCIQDRSLRENAEAKCILNKVLAAKSAGVAGVKDTRLTTRAVEQFISVVGVRGRRGQKWVDDRRVYLLPTSLTGPHMMLPDLPSCVPDADIFGAAACVIPGYKGSRLLLSGVGHGRKDIWDLDLSEVDGEWRQRGRLSEGRVRHTCPLDAVYHGDSTRIQKLLRYTMPNSWCCVMLNEDRQSVVLIGGYNRRDEDKDTHPVYRGAVRDILDDTHTGWQQVPCSWPLKKTEVFSPACCLVSVPSKRY